MADETNAAAEAQKKAKPLTFASMYTLEIFKRARDVSPVLGKVINVLMI